MGEDFPGCVMKGNFLKSQSDICITNCCYVCLFPGLNLDLKEVRLYCVISDRKSGFTVSYLIGSQALLCHI
jgi:hypothetical protein